MAALLAQQKFVATREFLTAKDGGLYNAYVNGGKPEAAIADLGQRFELEQIALRLWPSATLIQGMNTALFDLAQKHNLDGARVRKVQIALSKAAFDLHGGFGAYNGKFEALLSAHYAAAAILHDRALTLAQFEPRRYDDPRLRAFAAHKVEVRADPSVTHSQAKVDVALDDGTVLSACCEHPLGALENPLSRQQVEEKFRLYAADVIPEANLARVIGAIDRLEDFGSVRQLMDWLRRRGGERAMAAAE
jgi:2-methylcitrate dehydratase PrpD